MSTTYPGPRFLKGALVGLDPMKPLASVIVFQYNPETLTRRLSSRETAGGGGEGAKPEVLRLAGPPKETITLSAEVDAEDQVSDPVAFALGVYPALAALELLLYPPSSRVVANDILAQVGNIEIIPPEAPMTLFIWGAQRVLPVHLTDFSITEQAFDTLLNPVQAKVDLTLTVLSTADLKITDPGYSIFLTHQIIKELIGVTNLVPAAQSVASALKLQ
jgi:hypothetical protein